MPLLQIFGQVSPPPGVAEYGIIGQGQFPISSFLRNLIRLIRVIAGVFALINLILAGLQFVSSSGDPKKTAAAWQKIYMSGIGLLVIVISFVVAALLGLLFFGDASAILAPKIYGPGP